MATNENKSILELTLEDLKVFDIVQIALLLIHPPKL